MITFRRALIAAACFLSLIYILSRSHATTAPDSIAKQALSSDSATTSNGQSPSGSGSTNAASTSSSENLPPTKPRKPHSSQRLLADLSRYPLRDKLLYQFPYDVETKFPAYIWQTWKFAPSSGEFDEKFRPAEASWTEMHPGFVHEVITDDVAIHLLRYLYASIPEVLEAYHALPVPVLKADFFRYLVLLARGGIYSDIDTYAIQSAVDWLPASVPQEALGLVVGIEADPDRPDWADWYSRRIQFCQWTIQSKPGHPVLREIVARITQETLKRKKEGKLGTDSHAVVEFTGPAVWTDIIFEYFNDEKYFDVASSRSNITWRDFTGMTMPKKIGDVVVLPITSFSPGVGQMGAGDYDDPMAFVKHDFEGTWKPEEERHIGDIVEEEAPQEQNPI